MSYNESYFFCKHIAWQEEQSTNIIYVFDLKNNCSFLIDGVGRDIWLLINNHLSIDEMIIILSRNYAKSTNKITRDLELFILQMTEENLIFKM